MRRMIPTKKIDILNKMNLLNSDLNIDANVNSTGKITGNEIVENMSGYGVVEYDEFPNNEPIYASIVKNGNKLTMVYFGNFTTGADQTAITPRTLIGYTIPSSVGAKLYPQLENPFLNHLQDFVVNAFSDINVVKSGYGFIYKQNNAAIELNAQFPSLEASTKYQIRIEATFLLSDNLIS